MMTMVYSCTKNDMLAQIGYKVDIELKLDEYKEKIELELEESRGQRLATNNS